MRLNSQQTNRNSQRYPLFSTSGLAPTSMKLQACSIRNTCLPANLSSLFIGEKSLNQSILYSQGVTWWNLGSHQRITRRGCHSSFLCALTWIKELCTIVEILRFWKWCQGPRKMSWHSRHFAICLAGWLMLPFNRKSEVRRTKTDFPLHHYLVSKILIKQRGRYLKTVWGFPKLYPWVLPRNSLVPKKKKEKHVRMFLCLRTGIP